MTYIKVDSFVFKENNGLDFNTVQQRAEIIAEETAELEGWPDYRLQFVSGPTTKDNLNHYVYDILIPASSDNNQKGPHLSSTSNDPDSDGMAAAGL